MLAKNKDVQFGADRQTTLVEYRFSGLKISALEVGEVDWKPAEGGKVYCDKKLFILNMEHINGIQPIIG